MATSEDKRRQASSLMRPDQASHLTPYHMDNKYSSRTLNTGEFKDEAGVVYAKSRTATKFDEKTRTRDKETDTAIAQRDTTRSRTRTTQDTQSLLGNSKVKEITKTKQSSKIITFKGTPSERGAKIDNVFDSETDSSSSSVSSISSKPSNESVSRAERRKGAATPSDSKASPRQKGAWGLSDSNGSPRQKDAWGLSDSKGSPKQKDAWGLSDSKGSPKQKDAWTSGQPEYSFPSDTDPKPEVDLNSNLTGKQRRSRRKANRETKRAAKTSPSSRLEELTLSGWQY